MNTLVSDAEAAVGSNLDTVELLVSQPGSAIVRFPLPEGKTTVGSSPSCQIRLSSTAVRPLQCLIVRKGLELTVTRWAAGILLNGLDFTTAPLGPSDVLSIGDLRFEIAGPNELVNEHEATELSPVALIDEVAAQVAAEVAISEAPAPTIEPTNNVVHADLARLSTANKQARQRFRQLVGALRELRNEAHCLDQQVGALTEQLQAAQQTQDRLSSELHQSQAIATERESQIGEELDRAIAELTASYAKTEAATQEIEALRERNQQVQEQIDSLTTELAGLRELSNGYETEKLQFEQELANRETQLTHVRDEIAQLQQDFQASVTELQGRNGSLQEQLAEVQHDREREVAELQQGLEASVVELHEQNESLRGQLGELCSDRDRQIAELHGVNDSLRNEVATIAADRDRQVADLHGINDSLRNETAAIAADRDRQVADLHGLNESLRNDAEAFAANCGQRITELETLEVSLRNDLAAVIEERDRQLSELHHLSESLRQDVAAIASDRDRQIAELNGRCDCLHDELSAVIAERDHEIQQLREGMELTVRDLQVQAEQLTQQLTEQATERDRAIGELEQTHREIQDESAKQIESLHQQLATLNAERESQVSTLQSELEQARHAAEEAERLSQLPDSEKIELESELQSVRGERQKLAEEKHHLTLQLEDAEKRSKLLEIDVRSVNAEWQRSQSTVSRLQDELATAQAHAADLDARLCDFQCSVDIDRAVDSDSFAGNLAAVRDELQQRERALAESHAGNEQLRSQLSATEQELAACQENIVGLTQQIADLQAAAVEQEAETARLSGLVEQRTAQISEMEMATRETHQAYTADLTERDERVAELDSQLATARNELSCVETAAAAQIAGLNQQVTTLQEAATDADSERAHLVTAIKGCESRIAALTAAATESQRSNAVELAERDSRIKSLAAELEVMRQSLTAAASEDDAQLAELAAALSQTEQKLVSEVQAKENLAVEHAAEFSKLQEAIKAELTARDEQIADLSTQLERFRDNASTELSTQQQASDALQQQLLAAQETASVELTRREEQITELTRELHETQDQLADCAAQGERLTELYRQAQADLAELAAAPTQIPACTDPVAESTEVSSEPLHTAKTIAEILRVEDPRDNDAPRLERALASVASEPEVDEANTKTVPFQPASFIDRYSHIFDEDNDVEAPAMPTAQRVAESASRHHAVADEDSAALETYMANMMKRVRGEASSDAVVPPVPREPAAESASFSNPLARMHTLAQRVAVPTEPESYEISGESLIDLQELKQSSQKPPLPTSLSAMRELANSSARQAIAKHRKRRHFEGALSKLLVSGIAGATAAYMLLTADNYLSTYFLAGCGVAVVSGYWGFRLCGIVLEIIRDGINKESTPAELNDSTSPLPIDGISH